MRKTTGVSLLVVLVFSAFAVRGQQLKVGDKVPRHIIFTRVINYSKSSISLSDFKGKYIILDFWSPGCTSCIESFPKIDSLQKEFKDKVQFMLVNGETEDSTRRFLALLRKRIKIPYIPFITQDTILSGFFPQNFYPWSVWIDTSLKVQFITAGYNATSKHILAVLHNRKTTLYQLHYESDSVHEMRKNLFENRIKGAIYYSELSHCDPTGYRAGNLNGVKENGHIHLSRTGTSIAWLFATAVNQNGKYHFRPRYNVVLEVQDSFKYEEPRDINDVDRWSEKYLYNYDLELPIAMASRLYVIMKDDLERFFNATSTIEERMVDGYKLVRTGPLDVLKTHGGTPVDSFHAFSSAFPIATPFRYMRNIPFNELSHVLSGMLEYHFNKPMIDATGYERNIDIKIPGKTLDSFNLAELRSQLRIYGLDIIPQKIQVPELVIRENNINPLKKP